QVDDPNVDRLAEDWRRRRRLLAAGRGRRPDRWDHQRTERGESKEGPVAHGEAPVGCSAWICPPDQGPESVQPSTFLLQYPFPGRPVRCPTMRGPSSREFSMKMRWVSRPAWIVPAT